MIGRTLAHYQINAALGAGGMGEVWRATDTRLGRDVALKVLPEGFADDPERHARFEREARVLGSLNHPNIATLFGLEHLDGQHVLVMELVEGEGLDEVIARGPISIDEAVRIAVQIGEGLEAAHEAGIVHRDLKPGNVRIRADGTVKVLDFGLAKAWEDDTGNGSVSLSPTITRHHTQAGVILGTASYMAPEQAAGQAADRRADIWAFGVVLWEMLTGRRLFDGETISHVLASVLKDEIDLDALPEATPPRIRELVERCLRKKPKRRLQSIGDARILLDEWLADPTDAVALAEPATAAAASAGPPWRRAAPWAISALLAAALGTSLWLLRSAPPEVVRATIPPPPDTSFYLNPARPGPVAVSPDGRRLAFTAHDEDGGERLWVRNLGDPQAHALTGTEGAGYPFWAPDSRWLGFFVRDKGILEKIDVTGGPPIRLCEAANGKGGTWNEDGVIVFAPTADSPLHRVAASGGESQPITELDPANHRSHRHPRFLPDGEHFLYFARGIGGESGSIVIGSLGGGDGRTLVLAESQAEFAAGRVLFVRDGTLMAQPFDPARLELYGEATPVAEEVLMVSGAALSVFSASANGTLAYQTGRSDTMTTLEWHDRSGSSLGVLGDSAPYRTAALSPDGRYAVAEIYDYSTGSRDLWIYEIDRNLRTRFTFTDDADSSAVWAPDSETVYFASNRGGTAAIYRKAVGGASEEERVFASEGDTYPYSVSPDGRFLVFSMKGEKTKWDLWRLPLDGSGEPAVLRQTEFDEGAAGVSPDGRWLAFVSTESGSPETYVTTFPEPGRRWQISRNGGVYPQWTTDGREIVYSAMEGQLVAVEVSTEGDTFKVGASTPLFEIQPPLVGGAYFSVSGDGQRILVVPSEEQQADMLLNLFVNWPTALEGRR